MSNKVNKDSIHKILEEHEKWIRTGKRRGRCAELNNANLIGATINNANMRYSKLTNADLSNSELMDTDLTGADLSNAKLASANLFDTIFESANLRSANLSNAVLRSARLRSADLSNGNLSNSNMKLANLSNANLSNSNLNNANLSKSNLSNSDLSNADLRSVKGLTIKQISAVKSLHGAKIDPELLEQVKGKYIYLLRKPKLETHQKPEEAIAIKKDENYVHLDKGAGEKADHLNNWREKEPGFFAYAFFGLIYIFLAWLAFLVIDALLSPFYSPM